MCPRAGLTTQAVVDAAVDLADEDGLDRLTLARVADELGVKPPSLYEHVDGLEGLRKALRQRGLETMAAAFRRATTGRSRDDAVRALADAFRQFARDHPALYEATVRSVERDSPEIQAAAEDVLEILFAVLGGYRIQGEEAVHATRYLRSVLHGFASLEATGGFGMPTDLEKSFQRIVDATVLNLNRWSRRTD
jgi:AcrR family transcriptional regulator